MVSSLVDGFGPMIQCLHTISARWMSLITMRTVGLMVEIPLSSDMGQTLVRLPSRDGRAAAISPSREAQDHLSAFWNIGRITIVLA